MQLAIFSLVFSLALAQTTTLTAAPSANTACAALPVLEACLASTQAIASGCQSNDYNCLCSKYSDVLTCFQQCPNDPRQSSISSQQQQYCSNASIYSSASSSAISRSVSSSPTTTGSSPDSSATEGSDAVRTGSEDSSNTSASTGASQTPNAAHRNEIAGAVIGFAGLLGAIL